MRFSVQALTGQNSNVKNGVKVLTFKGVCCNILGARNMYTRLLSAFFPHNANYVYEMTDACSITVGIRFLNPKM